MCESYRCTVYSTLYERRRNMVISIYILFSQMFIYAAETFFFIFKIIIAFNMNALAVIQMSVFWFYLFYWSYLSQELYCSHFSLVNNVVRLLQAYSSLAEWIAYRTRARWVMGSNPSESVKICEISNNTIYKNKN